MPGTETEILIADDVPQMRQLLAGYLAELGFRRVEEVVNGLDVVAEVRGRKYDMLFLDIEMPGMNGLDALRLIRGYAPAMHVVIVSSQGTLDNVRTAVALGAKGFVVKPYTRDKVADMVKHLKG